MCRAQSLSQAKELMIGQNYCVGLIDYRIGAETCVPFLDLIGGLNSPFPTILLTGYDCDKVDDFALDAGAYDFIRKNSMTRELLQCSIRFAMRKHSYAKELSSTKNALEQAVKSREIFFQRIRTELNKLSVISEKITILETANNDPDEVERLKDEARSIVRLTAANCNLFE
jgi:DNA-binding NtrC family response regulator